MVVRAEHCQRGDGKELPLVTSRWVGHGSYAKHRLNVMAMLINNHLCIAYGHIFLLVWLASSSECLGLLKNWLAIE